MGPPQMSGCGNGPVGSLPLTHQRPIPPPQRKANEHLRAGGRRSLGRGNYSPPHRDAFLLLNQQLTPISSRCRVESKCRRDVSRAASCDATLVVSSGTLLV